MHLTDSFDYPAGLDRIGEMLADPGYTRQRLGDPRIQGLQVDVDEDGGTTTITASGSLDRDVLPSAAQRFVRGALTVRVVETWGPVNSGTRRGTTDVHVDGAPVRLRAESTLTDRGDTTSRAVQADVTVSVPLIGRSVEQRAARAVPQLLAREAAEARTWLAAHPA